MPQRFRLLFLACLAPLAGRAAIMSPVSPVPDEARCLLANRTAAMRHGIPAGLLEAIGRVESGRRAGTGIEAWPWTIDAEGTGYFLPSAAAATAAVRARQAAGARSIDVGCDQINLLYHPDAFATLEDAFDPDRNADYAARYLVTLHDRTNDWAAAAALYHSADPAEGSAYRARVLAAWTQAPAALANLPRDALTPRPFAFAPQDVARLLSLSAQAPPMAHAGLGTTGALASAGLGPSRGPLGGAPGVTGRNLSAYRQTPIHLARVPPIRTG